MAVTLPRAGNIGGGGFMLIYSAKTKGVTVLDFWQKAPGKASRTMFLDGEGKADSKLSRQSYLAVAVPGTVAGLAMVLKQYGTISLAKALAPAIRYAEGGFILSEKLVEDIRKYESILKEYPGAAKIFFKPGGGGYEAGERFFQKDLAKTLRQISRGGSDEFYRGRIADRIASQMASNGGLITKEDLAAYSPVVRQPVRGSYRGYDLYAMYPPSCGGTAVSEILNILEGYDLARFGHNSAASIHLTAEAMKRAFADVSVYIGDPEAVNVPVSGLISKAYAARLRESIPLDRATPAKSIREGDAPQYEKESTTHFSIVDREGNAVSCTFTLNGNFGSGIVVDGAGFLLNNEMDNFNTHPGTADSAGPIQGEANAVAPHKRMLSAMVPTIVLKNGSLFLVTGSPGSSRIISTVAQVIMNVIDYGMNIQEAVNAPKVHHEWLPDELRIEKGISPDTIGILQEMGHSVVVGEPMGAASSIMVDQTTGMRYGAADPRRDGLALGY
jgi:gamma-glutamyltranspeptidase/glutathione hydrolase